MGQGRILDFYLYIFLGVVLLVIVVAFVRIRLKQVTVVVRYGIHMKLPLRTY